MLALATGAVGVVAPTASAAPEAASAKAPAPVTWHQCAPGDLAGVPAAELPQYSCADYAVPLNHDRPNQGTINIAMMRRAADDQAARIGSLFINPGGPGGSGFALPKSGRAIFEPQVLDRFDLIGFDPRGVARSTPLRCFATEEDADQVFGRMAPLPVTAQEERTTLRAIKDYGQFCARFAGPLLEHMATKDVARDLDVMRQAVGDAKLNYVGFSYGTLLGATYVNMFPNRTRAIILDGNVDPTLRLLDGVEYDRQRTGGFEIALDGFLSRCDSAGAGCSFGGGARHKYDSLRNYLRHQGPITLSDGTVVDEAAMTGTVASALYSPSVFTQLADLLQELWAAISPSAEAARSAPAATGATLRTLQAAGRPRADLLPDTPYTSDDSYLAVNCADKPFDNRPSEVPAIADRWERQMPDFGRYQAWSDPALCPSWPVKDADAFRGPWNRRTDNPVLVFGNYYDPATQYEFAKRMSRQLGNARLVSVDSFGHCILGDSSCTDVIAADFLVDLEVPGPGTVCHPDVQPFPAPPPARTS
ncbi:alpha/beta hydrolase [Actinophytocola oryzae]|uniref:Alpha/beta hydrolase family protein n=1 Tax=Actinophytocola oryzae TaxID=502181 RepID=A0A4R7V550_9PSEU|nr:alpha/beta hydrolase [Actinophytocola oryzae]TDV42636.1 alpha/beta hydrolase family protein [Actinophytocola oryzae]